MPDACSQLLTRSDIFDRPSGLHQEDKTRSPLFLHALPLAFDLLYIACLIPTSVTSNQTMTTCNTAIQIHSQAHLTYVKIISAIVTCKVLNIAFLLMSPFAPYLNTAIRLCLVRIYSTVRMRARAVLFDRFVGALYADSVEAFVVVHVSFVR